MRGILTVVLAGACYMPELAPGGASSDASTTAPACTGSHDEDFDGLADGCDPCPHLAGTAADGDGDGVGDACDPQPTIAKQRIRYFDPFTAARGDWQYGTGTSLFGGDQLRVFPSSTSRSRLAVANGEQRIITAGTIASITPVATRQLTIDVGHDATESTYHYIELYNPQTPSTNVQVTERFADGGTNDLGRIVHPTEMPLGAFALQVDMSIAAQRLELGATLGGTSYATIVGDTSTNNPLVAGPSIHLYGREGDFRFDYFLVIETVP